MITLSCEWKREKKTDPHLKAINAVDDVACSAR